MILIGSLTLLIVLGLIIIFTIFSIQKNVENTQRVSETSAKMALCQSAVRGFLLNAWSDTVFVKTGTNPEFEKFQTETELLDKNIQYLKQNSSDEEATILLTTEKSSHQLQQNFKRIGENFACAVKTSSMSPDQLRDHMQIVGMKKVHPKNETEKPVSRIFAIGHFGNFELFAHASSAARFSVA